MPRSLLHITVGQYRAIRKRLDITVRGPAPGMTHVYEHGVLGVIEFLNFGKPQSTSMFPHCVRWDSNNNHAVRAIATVLGITSDELQNIAE